MLGMSRTKTWLVGRNKASLALGCLMRSWAPKLSKYQWEPPVALMEANIKCFWKLLYFDRELDHVLDRQLHTAGTQTEVVKMLSSKHQAYEEPNKSSTRLTSTASRPYAGEEVGRYIPCSRRRQICTRLLQRNPTCPPKSRP
jgi:hypothetical protein